MHKLLGEKHCSLVVFLQERLGLLSDLHTLVLLLDVDLGQALQAGSMLRNGCKTQRTLPNDACVFPRDCSIVY